jgi:hypothetical protein
VDANFGIKRGALAFFSTMSYREGEVAGGVPARYDDDAVLGELRRAIDRFDPLPRAVAAAGRTALARACLMRAVRDLPRDPRDLPSPGDAGGGDALPRWAFLDRRELAP